MEMSVFYLHHGNDILATQLTSKVNWNSMLDRYVEFVQEQAKALDLVFILDTGEGRDAYDKELDIDIEDLSGWLISPEEKEKAISIRINNETEFRNLYRERYCFAEWQYDEKKLKIAFRYASEYM